MQNLPQQREKIVGSLALAALAATALLLTFIPSANIRSFVASDAPAAERPAAPSAGPLAKRLAAPMAPGATTVIGDLVVRYWIDPLSPQAAMPGTVRWRITDTAGLPVPIDTTMHNFPLHVYGVREDLRDATLHLHPSSKGDGYFADPLTFPSPGRWRLQMQFAKDDTLYELATTVDVDGAPGGALPAHDLAREQETRQFAVTMKGPERLVVGEPARLAFAIRHDPRFPPKTDPVRQLSDARTQHNFILAHEGGDIIWNHHGDATVDSIGERLPLRVVRNFTPDTPYDYHVTFPRPGMWRILFEQNGEHAPFHVYVNEK